MASRLPAGITLLTSESRPADVAPRSILSPSWRSAFCSWHFNQSCLQVSLSLSMNPPKQGEESYDLWKKERDNIIASMTRRAHIMTDGFNSLEGVSCNFTEGAMYSFPQIHLPSKVGTGRARAARHASTMRTLGVAKQHWLCLKAGNSLFRIGLPGRL